MLQLSTPLGDLRFVHIYLGAEMTHSMRIVHQSQVETLLEAMLKLHFEPGINPHNGKKAAELMEVRVAEPQIGEPLWWTSPSLGSKDPAGARIVHQDYVEHVIWRRPSLEQRYADEQAEMLRLEAAEAA